MQSVDTFYPESHQVYFADQYSVFQVLSGQGALEVDFQTYHNWQDKLLFLEKGQYIKFLSDRFYVRQTTFPDDVMLRHQDVRVLFKHLVSLGYISLVSRKETDPRIGDVFFEQEMIDIMVERWFLQDPFHADRKEYRIIFDTKELIDSHYARRPSLRELVSRWQDQVYDPFQVFRSKIGMTIKSSLRRKQLIESKRQLAFTDRSVKEIAYEMGFRDPAYFCRVFKQSAGGSPLEFRDGFAYTLADRFVNDLYALLSQYHRTERKVEFYAHQLHMSVKTLARKVRAKLNTSPGHLVRQEVINSARDLLRDGMRIREVAENLGFEEPNHFSAFFKHYTGMTPTRYQQGVS